MNTTQRTLGPDGALPGRARLPHVDATPPPPEEMNTPPVDGSDTIYTWASLMFVRAKLLGIAEPVFELRMLKTNQGTISGYYSDLRSLTEMIIAQDKVGAEPKSKRESIYATLNPCSPELLARASNRVEVWARHTTSDPDIVRRIFLPLDFDPKRPAGISSTEAEHNAAIERAQRVRAWLSEMHFPEPIVGDSGNGAHLVYGIDLPNDADSLALINRCLQAVAAKCVLADGSDGGVAGDTTVGNAARIWKFYGTHARKGDPTETRPHRMARILSLPEILLTVPRERLEALAALAPSSNGANGAKSTVGKSNGTPGTKSKGVHEPDLDVPAWLETHGLKVTKTKPYGKSGDGTLWELECCPMDPAHANNAACVIKFGNGVVTAKCHHNGCADKGWREWREKVGDPVPEQPAPAPSVPPYTAEEIAAFAASQGCTVEEFRYRWIIQHDTAYYIFADGRYLSPIRFGSLPAALKKRDLLRVPREKSSPAGLDWYRQTKLGWVPKSLEEVLAEYATVARKTVASLVDSTSRYDEATQTFFEAVCPLRSIKPAYDERIDKWLRLLGGASAEKLLDWVATVTRLERVTCAVYIHGPKDCGKTMFASGMARLWGNAPTALKALTGNFNSALTNSPLVFADEEIPANMTSGFLRREVGSSSRPLTRKFLPEAELLGAIRMVIAANTPDLLRFDDEDFTEDDIAAVAARILYIKPDLVPGSSPPRSLAGDYLISLGGRVGTEGWVENGDKIAAHALWLRDNRVVNPGSRFLVEGEISTMHRRLATHGSIRGLVIEWIAKALLDDTKYMQKNPGIQFGDGKLFVNAGYIKSTWEQILDDKRGPPSLKKIGQALRPLAQDERRLPFGERRADFYDLQLLPVYEAMRDLQVGIIDDYKKLIDGPSRHWPAAPR